MSVYPSNIPTTGDLPDAGANLSSNPHSSLHDDVRDEVIAIAGELGVEPSGTANTVRARLDDGLGLREVIVFSALGTSNFSKASYPWLRAVRVRVQGGGGGGGGVSGTTAGQASTGRGGAGGVYAESFIAASTLGSTVTVTVGAGGAGGVGVAGTAGGTSSFGSLVSANGGTAGETQAGFAAGNFIQAPVAQPTTGTGDIVVPGSAGSVTFLGLGAIATDFHSSGGSGGDSVLGSGGRQRVTTGNGLAAAGFGSGGGGALNTENNAGGRNGAPGAQGIVIVELYA